MHDPCDKPFQFAPCSDLDLLQGQSCCRAGDHNSQNLFAIHFKCGSISFQASDSDVSTQSKEKMKSQETDEGSQSEGETNEKFSVSKIIDMRTVDGKTEYLLKWKNFSELVHFLIIIKKYFE